MDLSDAPYSNINVFALNKDSVIHSYSVILAQF